MIRFVCARLLPVKSLSDCVTWKGNLVNVIEWHLLDEDITGRLEVGCTYELDRRGRMVVSLKGHRLLPDSKMPKDPNDLVSILQRAMPYEMFDPSGCAMHTSVSHVVIFVNLLRRDFRRVGLCDARLVSGDGRII